MWIEIAMLSLGLVLLFIAGDKLVDGATKIAEHFGVSTLMIGLTVVGFGTSAPELFVSVLAALRGTADVAIGNVIGSNIFNVLVIVGLAGILSPFVVSKDLLKRELPVMVAVVLLFHWMCSTLLISRVMGGALFTGILVYLYASYRTAKGGRLPAEHRPQDCALGKNIAWVFFGLVGLIGGAHLIVESATVIAEALGVPDLVIAVTLIAVGTSLPEIATTVVAALKGDPKLAVGSAVGSNIFNVLCVIGLTSLVEPLQVNALALTLDLPVMSLAALAGLVAMFLFQKRFARLPGLLFLGLYGVYLYFLLQGLQDV